MIHKVIKFFVKDESGRTKLEFSTIECNQKSTGEPFLPSLVERFNEQKIKYEIENPTNNEYHIIFDEYPNEEIREYIWHRQGRAETEDYFNNKEPDDEEIFDDQDYLFFKNW